LPAILLFDEVDRTIALLQAVGIGVFKPVNLFGA
jgi:hypothetical protein